MTKRLICAFLALWLCLSQLPFGALGYEPQNGSATDTIDWSYADGILTITGTGAIPDYTTSNPPSWYSLYGRVTRLVIGSGITRIGELSFEDFYKTVQVELPDTLQSIGDSAFGDCLALHQLELPATVSSFHPGALRGSGVQEILVSDGNSTYQSLDGVLLSRDGTRLICFPPAYQPTEYTIPNTVNRLEDGCFSSIRYLKHLLIPGTVTEIGQNVFLDSAQFDTIGPIGSGCELEYGWDTALPDRAFAGLCPSQLHIPGSVTRIGTDAISGCSELIYELGVEDWYAIEGAQQIPAESMVFLQELTDGSWVIETTEPTPYPTHPPEETLPPVTEPPETQPPETEPPETEPPATEPPEAPPEETLPEEYMEFPEDTDPGDVVYYPLELDTPTLALSEKWYLTSYYYDVRSFYHFTPESDGIYQFTATSYAKSGTWANLYNSDYRLIARHTREWYTDFDFTMELKAGETYILEVWTSGSDIDHLFRAWFDPFWIQVQKVHQFETTVHRPHSPTEPGTLKQVCTDCGFSQVIPDPDPHSWVDGICTICGTDVLVQGDLTERISWSIDGNGTLTISGSGEMPDLTYRAQGDHYLAPWQDYSQRVSSIVVEDGITKIGANSFWGMRNAASISLPGSLTTLGENCLLGCLGLFRITIPYGVTTIRTPLHSNIVRFNGDKPEDCTKELFLPADDSLELLYNDQLPGWASIINLWGYYFYMPSVSYLVPMRVTPEEYCFDQPVYHVPVGQSMTVSTNFPEVDYRKELDDESAFHGSWDRFYFTKAGTYTVTFSSLHGAYTASCQIICTDAPPVGSGSITLDGTAGSNLCLISEDADDQPRTSWLNPTSSGGLERVQWIPDTGLVITQWDSAGALIRETILEPELPLFGGYLKVKDHHYLFYGQENPEGRADMEVFRLVRFSADWTRLDSIPIFSKNTLTPFYQSNAALAEDQGLVYIHTAHSIHQSVNGTPLQSSITFVIDPEKKTVESSPEPDDYTKIDLNRWYIRCSHNQQLLVRDGQLYRMDSTCENGLYLQRQPLGDLTAPGVFFGDLSPDDGSHTYFMHNALSNPSVWDDQILVGRCTQNKVYWISAPLGFELPNDFTRNQTIFEYPHWDNIRVSTPYLIPVSESLVVALWENHHTDGDYYRTALRLMGRGGEPISRIIELDTRLSDCVPFLNDAGQIVWYASDGQSIRLYTLDWSQLLRDPAVLEDTFPHRFHTEVTEPNCQKGGYTTYTCTECGYQYVADLTPIGNHSFVQQITEPGCNTWGFTTHTCQYCRISFVNTYTDPLGHIPGQWCATHYPNCEHGGQVQRECQRGCGFVEQGTVAPLEHRYIRTAVVEPTCTGQGYTSYTCPYCQDSYEEDHTDPLGHDFGEWIVTKEPDCIFVGSEQRECSRCHECETREIPPTGHHHTQSQVLEPTCTEQGYTVYTCICGDSYLADYTDPLGHEWDEGVVTVEPTEETEGEITYTCLRCTATKTEVLPKLDHIHNYSADVTAPTCTEKGFTTHTCACGDSYVDNYTEPMGHDLGEWAVVTAPTCTDNGTERSVCSRCDYDEERVTDPTGHSYCAATTAPTCTEQGFTTYTCDCGESYVDDYTDALGHAYEDGICTRCGAEDPDDQEPVENPFTDVPAGSFYEAPVLWAVENGITNGATADTFNPNGQCQRAHVVTFLWRAAGQPEPISTENPFVDVKETDFYYKAVLWAVENGITNGLDATHFGSFEYCNRAQVVTFLYRAMGSPAVTAAECPFTDVAPGAWYEAPILWAVENGITNGLDAVTFGVNTICNRAQVVTFLYRAFN